MMIQNKTIIDGKVVDTLTGEVLSDYSVYVNECGSVKFRNKRKYVRNTKEVSEVILDIYNNSVRRKHKPISVLYKTIDYLKALGLPMKREYLEQIATLLGYKGAWIDFKLKELL